MTSFHVVFRFRLVRVLGLCSSDSNWTPYIVHACIHSIGVRFLNSQQALRLLLTCEGILGLIKHKNSQLF